MIHCIKVLFLCHPKVPKALILLGFRDFLYSFPKMVPVCLKR